jgi:hypothetical protein
MNRDRKCRCDPASWTKGSDSLIQARATPAVSRAPTIRRALAYRLRWSASILDEMERNLVSSDAMSRDKASRLRALMERAFPEAEVYGFEPLVPAMQNEAKDRHVAAAALKPGAQVIVTSNLKHFTLLPEGIEAQSPDEFLCNLFDLDPDALIELLREQASDLVKPPMTFEQILDRLARVVPEFVEAARRYIAPGAAKE